MAKESNPNKPNWPGAFQNVLIVAMQKGLGFPILIFCFCIAIYGLTPDELKKELWKAVESLRVGRAGWVLSFFVIVISGKIIFRQRASHKAEIERVCAERDKYQKQCGVEIESSDE